MTDHAPVDLVVALAEAQERSKAWRMNTSVSQNESLCAIIKKHIKTFFEINNGTADQIIVWDTFKSYIRGIIIQQTSLIKKQDKIKMTQYEEEIKGLESEFWENPNNTCLTNLVNIKYKLNTILTKKSRILSL